MHIQIVRPSLLVLMVTMLSGAQAFAQEPPRVRPSIDDPTFDLALYKHAIGILKSRDPKKDDPKNPIYNSYAFFARLHNGEEGASHGSCVHGNELFLPWHRALLRLFEEALQESDPPATRKLMLPYWNWTEKPSGGNFPKAFEDDPKSVLNTDSENDLVKRQPGRKGKTFTTAELRETIRSALTWESLAGSASGCEGSTCRFGALEAPSHNQMHNWVGGQMLNDQTAAEDPLFWSFHAYEDLLYACWEKGNPGYAIGCPDCDLKGLTGWTPRRVRSTEILGYTYDWRNTPCDEGPARFAALTAVPSAALPSNILTLSRAEVSAASAPIILDITIPQATFSTAHLRLSGMEVFPDYNYEGRVYLYPAGVAFQPNDAAFDGQYSVGDLAVWGTAPQGAGHEGHGQEVTQDINVTTEFKYLAKKQPGAKWKFALVVYQPIPQSSSKLPKTATQVAKEITFDTIAVVYDRDYTEGKNTHGN